ncbi:hypothetical protein PIB30_001486, partial [Stylosanthes scabra]|nr:hypothetical protein [Stylosanthes scabra]
NILLLKDPTIPGFPYAPTQNHPNLSKPKGNIGICKVRWLGGGSEKIGGGGGLGLLYYVLSLRLESHKNNVEEGAEDASGEHRHEASGGVLLLLSRATAGDCNRHCRDALHPLSLFSVLSSMSE